MLLLTFENDTLVKSWLIQIVLNPYQYPPETKISQINYTMFFLICNRIDCYITINTFEHVVYDLSDTPYSSTFPHKFTFYRVFARKKLNWEFPVSNARSILWKNINKASFLNESNRDMIGQLFCLFAST